VTEARRGIEVIDGLFERLPRAVCGREGVRRGGREAR